MFDDEKEDNSPNMSWWLAIPILIVATGLIWLIAPYISSVPNVKESMEKQLQTVKVTTTIGGVLYAIVLLKFRSMSWIAKCFLIVVDIVSVLAVWQFGALYYYAGEFWVPQWIEYGPASVNVLALILAIVNGRKSGEIGPLQ